MRIAVLDGFSIDQGELTWDELGPLGDVTVHPRTQPAEVLPRARGAQVILTNKVVLGRSTIDALPELRYVGVVATGTNVVDFDACRARKIAVTNVPDYGTRSVAQLVMALLLTFIEDVSSYTMRVKPNGWAEAPDYCFFLKPRFELAQKTMAIVGLGSIGRNVAELARAFGMKVVAAAVPGGTSSGRVPLETALGEADVVSLHCPLTERTSGLVNRQFLHSMKAGAILINTGRGALIDERSLIESLAENRLGGALLDVLSVEPPPRDHPLLDPSSPWAHRVIVTPHIGWGAVEARRRLMSVAAQNLAAFFRGERSNRLD